MSNTELANIYANIIEDVIAESRQDFENSGIDEATLQDLRKIWMEKLSLSQTAEFSWSKKDEIEQIEDSNSLALHTQDFNQIEQLNNITDLNTNSTGLEYPNLSIQTKQEDSNLVLPTGGRIINQNDGNFELIINVNNKQDAKDYLQKLAKRDQKYWKILSQIDGSLSDDDNDDINSDLDDSDSMESEDDSDDQEGNIMLCLYDKVQRVKNKWKCNLKEGIASLNGKDYTFQKATSESEW